MEALSQQQNTISARERVEHECASIKISAWLRFN